MKKIVVFVVLITITLNICSCKVAWDSNYTSASVFENKKIDSQSNKNSTNVSERENEEIKSEQIFLIAFSEGVSSDTFLNFVDSKEYGLNLSLERTQLPDVEATKEHPLNAQELLQYSYSEVLPIDTAENGRTFYGIYDFYKLNGERVCYLHNSDIVCFYFKPSNDTEYPVMSENEVKNIADEFLLSMIPESNFANFTYEGMSTDIFGRYALLYERYVCGYATDETLSVWIDQSGEVSGYNGYNVTKYDTLIDNINKDAIKLSVDALLSELKSLELTDFKVYSPELTTNFDGDVFVSFDFFYTSDGMPCAETAYLKVN